MSSATAEPIPTVSKQTDAAGRDFAGDPVERPDLAVGQQQNVGLAALRNERHRGAQGARQFGAAHVACIANKLDGRRDLAGALPW